MSVPRDIFKGVGAEIVPDKAETFKGTLKARYPWLTDNSVDVFMKKARNEMLRVMDEETGGRSIGKYLDSDGKTWKAIGHLQKHLEETPDDIDSWYLLGEMLCKVGRAEEGYKAFAKGRGLFEK